jgi:DNA-dependent protein kinase catalytic subunit
VYDVFIQGVIQLIQRLDLSYSVQKIEEEATPTSEIPEANGALLSTLQPRVPKDMEIFLSLVELVKRLLGSTATESFMRWPYLFGREIAAISARLPMISGFYKLMTLSLRLCDKHGYFRRMTPDDTLMTDDDSDRQKQLCFSLYSKFIRDVLVRL